MPRNIQLLVGLALGLATVLSLGPRSPFLPRDRIIANVDRIDLLDAPGGQSQRIAFPSRIDGEHLTRFDLLEQRRVGSRLYYHVRLTVPATLALKSYDGRLREGDRIDGWIAARDAAKPISAVGDTLLRMAGPIANLFVQLLWVVMLPLVFVSLVATGLARSETGDLLRSLRHVIILSAITGALAIVVGLVAGHFSVGTKPLSGSDVGELMVAYRNRAEAVNFQAAVIFERLLSPLHPFVAKDPGPPSSWVVVGVFLLALLFARAVGLLQGNRAKRIGDLSETVRRALVEISAWIEKVGSIILVPLLLFGLGSIDCDLIWSFGRFLAMLMISCIAFAVIFYGVGTWLISRITPFKFLADAFPAVIYGFSTASAAAAMPITFICADRIGVSARSIAVVAPLSRTIQFSGALLSHAMSMIFISRLVGSELSVLEQLSAMPTLIVMTVLSGGHLGGLAAVLSHLRLSPASLALVVWLEPFISRCRSAINAVGDLFAIAAVATMAGESVGSKPETTT